ncbi:MAG: hypothetical protein MRJ92_10420 [Nitrospira sp.]|nr:hypothetical protein [Nitrospira sp.]
MQAGIAVLVNRPLNAMPAQRGGVVRLADVSVPAAEATVEGAERQGRALEEEYRTSLAPAVTHSGQGMLPSDFFRWADELTRYLCRRSRPAGKQIEQHMIAPHVNQVLRALAEAFTGTVAEQWESWRDRYVPESARALERSAREAASVQPSAYRRLASYAQLCCRSRGARRPCRRKSLAGAATQYSRYPVLVGMRSPTYVDDAFQMLQWDTVSQPQHVYVDLRRKEEACLVCSI